MIFTEYINISQLNEQLSAPSYLGSKTQNLQNNQCIVFAIVRKGIIFSCSFYAFLRVLCSTILCLLREARAQLSAFHDK